MYIEEIKKRKKIFPKESFCFLFMASTQITGTLVFPITGCPALPSSKTYQSIYQIQEFLVSNKDQVNIYLGRGPLHLSWALIKTQKTELEYQG